MDQRMTEREAALARCDAEIARIEQEGAENQEPAWLITLAIFDWEAEKRAIEREFPVYVYAWGPRMKASNLPQLNRKGQHCGLIARGKMNSAMIGFADGEIAIVSRNALRRFGEKRAIEREDANA